MRKFLSVMCIFMIMISIGCGEEQSRKEEDSFVEKATYLKEREAELKRLNMSEGIIIKNGFWVEKEENISEYLDAWESQDDEFFAELVKEGKIYHVDKETRIYFSNEKLNNGKIVQIRFLQGKYKNKTGYIMIKFIK